MLIDSEKLDVLKKAEANDPRALYRLGLWHMKGRYVPKCREKAKTYYTRLIKLGPNAVNGLNAIQDYPQMVSFLGHIHFNDEEIHLAKKYLLMAGTYLRKNFAPCVADQRIEEERIHNCINRINRALGIKEDLPF